MVRLLLLLVAAPAALGLENVDFLPHFRHGHHFKKHEHAAHKHGHTHELKLKAEESPEVVKMANPAVEASTPAATTTAAATPAATTPAATTTQVASAQVVTTPAATTPAATTPAATTPVPVVEAPAFKEADPVVEVQAIDNSASAGTSQLQVDLAEMKENKVHIAQLEQTLRADASLLRESSTLEHVSHSTRGHASAARQVRQAAQLVKGTEAMLRESRADAVDKSQAMLREAAVARDAADSLSAEAAEELKLFQSSAPAQEASSEPVAKPAAKHVEASSEEDIDIEDEN